LLQLLDLAREKTALERELRRLRAERAVLQHVLDQVLEIVAEEAVSEGRARADDQAGRQTRELRNLASLAKAVAHEINNPLMVIVGTLELMGTHHEPSPEISRIAHACERIQAIVERLQRINRLEMIAEASAGDASMMDIRRSSEPTPPLPDS
jgi:signal transduction histidine kinase